MGNHDDEVADMAAAAALMRSRNKRVVCLLGHSKGGTNVVQYAATIGDIANVINLAGRFDVKAGVMQRVRSVLINQNSNLAWLMALQRLHKISILLFYSLVWVASLVIAVRRGYNGQAQSFS
jgi:glycerol-3-phosphate dehydrogenase